MHSLHQAFSFVRMNVRFVFMVLLFSEITGAQSLDMGYSFDIMPNTAYYSLDVPVDARSVAMGESFVAVNGTSSVHIFNPASLASVHGVTVSYNRRSRTFVDPVVAKYQSVSVSMYTSLASVGIFYSRYDYDDDINLMTPKGTANGINMYNYVFGATLALSVGENFQVGATCKTFTITENVGSLYNFSTNNAMLFDLGIQYSTPFVLNNQFYRDEFRGGISLQNFGTVLRHGTFFPSDPQRIVRLPRYLRLGFSYRIDMLNNRPDKLKPLSILVSGEYRNLLNALDTQSDSKDFWGFGTELSVLEIASLRVGGYISPMSGWYGRRGKASFRYGLGLNIPLQRVAEIPWSFKFDYSVIPLATVFSTYDSYPVFSIEVQYLQDIF